MKLSTISTTIATIYTLSLSSSSPLLVFATAATVNEDNENAAATLTGGNRLRGGGSGANNNNRKLATEYDPTWDDVHYACTPCETRDDCPAVVHDKSGAFVQQCNDYGFCQAIYHSSGHPTELLLLPDDCTCKLHADCKSNWCEGGQGRNKDAWGTCETKQCESEVVPCDTDGDCSHLYDANEGDGMVFPFCMPHVKECGKKEYIVARHGWEWKATQKFNCGCTTGDQCVTGHCNTNAVSASAGTNFGLCDHPCYGDQMCPNGKSCHNNICVDYCWNDDRCGEGQTCHEHRCVDTCTMDVECQTRHGDNPAMHTCTNNVCGPPTSTSIFFKDVDDGPSINARCVLDNGVVHGDWRTKDLSNDRAGWQWNVWCKEIHLKVNYSGENNYYHSPRNGAEFKNGNMYMYEHGSQCSQQKHDNEGLWNQIRIPTDPSRGRKQGCVRVKLGVVTFKDYCSENDS